MTIFAHPLVTALIGPDSERQRLYVISSTFHRSIDTLAAMLPLWVDGMYASAMTTAPDDGGGLGVWNRGLFSKNDWRTMRGYPRKAEVEMKEPLEEFVLASYLRGTAPCGAGDPTRNEAAQAIMGDPQKLIDVLVQAKVLAKAESANALGLEDQGRTCYVVVRPPHPSVTDFVCPECSHPLRVTLHGPVS